MYRSKGFPQAKPGKSSAFTLIELLVVIAIIAILAAILFPVFAQAREKARQTACLSNLKQIGTALMMYTQDYDETLPHVQFGYTIGGAPVAANALCSYKWMDVIQPYVKSDEMFSCPSDSSSTRKFQSLANAAGNPRIGNTSTTTPTGGSYSINESYSSPVAGATNPQGQSLAVIARPADTIFGVESQSVPGNRIYWSNWYYANDWTFSADPAGAGMKLNTSTTPNFFGVTDSANRRYFFYARHSQMGNVLFCDGRVKAHRADQVAARRANSAGRQVLYMWTCEED